MKIQIQMSRGYAGKDAAFSKGYVAKITGTDEHGLSRAFQHGKPTSDDPYRKAKCQWVDEYEVEDGLYEVSEGGDKDLRIVYHKDGKQVRHVIDGDRAKKIASLMDAGQSFEEARIATRTIKS